MGIFLFLISKLSYVPVFLISGIHCMVYILCGGIMVFFFFFFLVVVVVLFCFRHQAYFCAMFLEGCFCYLWCP